MSGASDNFAVRVVVVAACVLAVGGMVGMVAMAFIGIAIPDQIDRVVSLALGGALGLLAKTSTGTEQVQVANEGAAEAIPTEAVSPKQK